MHSTLLCAALVPFLGITAAAAGGGGVAAPAPNAWTQVADDGVGPRVAPALVWSAARQRFVMIGGTISHERKPPFPYDVLSFDAAAREWQNDLPAGGESWGPAVGPVDPPKFKSPYFALADVDGNARLWQRHARLAYNARLAPWDGRLYAVVCGRTLAYDPDRRTWTNLQPPAASNPAPQTQSEREGLNWTAVCPDPVNRELLLFGGGGVLTPRGDPGTWAYSTAGNAWRPLDLKAQPPPRALAPMAYDPAAKKIVLFGGDGLDTLYADTWVYDCATRTWEERRPKVSPAPRFGHALLHLPKSGKVVLLGGVGYTSSTAYQAGLYRPHPFEVWTYDVAGNEWSLVRRYEAADAPAQSPVDPAVAAVDDADRVLWWGPKSAGGRTDRGSKTWVCTVDATAVDRPGTAAHGVPPGTVARRTGPYDPAWYAAADVPAADPAAQKSFYEDLPANQWTPVAAPKWPANRQVGGWSTVAYDTDRGQLLHLGGGHSSYFGNDVAHFDTVSARWTISYRPQFALDFNYDLTGPGPYAFNGGPWGNHNYHAYAYDPARRRLVFVRGPHTFFYDPASRQWRHDERIDANPFGGSKYTSYLASTTAGVVLWAFRANSQSAAAVWRLRPTGWAELETSGEPLPLPVTDGSTITIDVRRDRLLLTTTRGEKGVAHSGQVWSCDLKTGRVTKLDPAGRGSIDVKRFARESVLLPKQGLVLVGYHLGRPDRVPFYDVPNNRWLAATLPGSAFFAHKQDGVSVDLGLQYDAARDLVWAVMCDLRPGGLNVLRLDATLKLAPLP